MTLPFAHRITTFTERRKMTEKTLEQIRQEYGSRAAALMNARHDRVEEIAAERRLPDGEYLDRLTDEQRNRILLERKTAAAGGDRRRVRQQYRDLHARYEEDLAELVEHRWERWGWGRCLVNGQMRRFQGGWDALCRNR